MYRDIENELTLVRKKTQQQLIEMVELVKWAAHTINPIKTINPVTGGTMESDGCVHQIVGDFDDLELACHIAQQRNAITETELARVRTLLESHRD